MYVRELSSNIVLKKIGSRHCQLAGLKLDNSHQISKWQEITATTRRKKFMLHYKISHLRVKVLQANNEGNPFFQLRERSPHKELTFSKFIQQ